MRQFRSALACLVLVTASPLAAQASLAPVGEQPALTTYKIKGSKKLRPVRIGDDGQRTYIQWSEDQPIPAVFVLDARGAEQMVDGYMRGELYTIDAVYPRLVFRIDRDRTEAQRNSPKATAP